MSGAAVPGDPSFIPKATAIAREAGARLREFFIAGVETEYKGDVDLVKAIKIYREVGYPYMLMPDHVPVAPNDQEGLQSFAFCYGYIRGLIQSLEKA